jgi:hypothetical protein
MDMFFILKMASSYNTQKINTISKILEAISNDSYIDWFGDFVSGHFQKRVNGPIVLPPSDSKIGKIRIMLEIIDHESLIYSLEIRVYQYLRKRILMREIETMDSVKLLNLLYYLKNLEDRDITESRLVRILENLEIEEGSG